MKKIIIILGTIILGIYIVSSLILGGSGSLKDSSDTVVNRGNDIINRDIVNFK